MAISFTIMERYQEIVAAPGLCSMVSAGHKGGENYEREARVSLETNGRRRENVGLFKSYDSS